MKDPHAIMHTRDGHEWTILNVAEKDEALSEARAFAVMVEQETHVIVVCLLRSDALVWEGGCSLVDIHSDRLRSLLSDLDVPDFRRNDVRWLSRNLGVRNAKDSATYNESRKIILWLLRHGIYFL